MMDSQASNVGAKLTVSGGKQQSYRPYVGHGPCVAGDCQAFVSRGDGSDYCTCGHPAFQHE